MCGRKPADLARQPLKAIRYEETIPVWEGNPERVPVPHIHNSVNGPPPPEGSVRVRKHISSANPSTGHQAAGNAAKYRQRRVPSAGTQDVVCIPTAPPITPPTKSLPPIPTSAQRIPKSPECVSSNRPLPYRYPTPPMRTEDMNRTIRPGGRLNDQRRCAQTSRPRLVGQQSVEAAQESRQAPAMMNPRTAVPRKAPVPTRSTYDAVKDMECILKGQSKKIEVVELRNVAARRQVTYARHPTPLPQPCYPELSRVTIQKRREAGQRYFQMSDSR
ncbi:hypothetical protein K491DRAFT_250593 [Lophiostoma macrostomum CBS 122681]|uniref:Uncharacterized protein n=1 Tax=Lophiostoma macrostomum CBS 122681 TaxID=1314788 RepID=A0A6A6SMU7_9PLEO|nr:hypothetical protein K491DRAFT_250593 [Lophiostoma macrostomum CBS 122681]